MSCSFDLLYHKNIKMFDYNRTFGQKCKCLTRTICTIHKSQYMHIFKRRIMKRYDVTYVMFVLPLPKS